MRELRGKWALVTGAGSGIGRAIALRLAREGTHVWLVDIRPQPLAAVAEELRELGVESRQSMLDLADTAAVEQLARDVLAAPLPLDLLVNNAGVAYYGPTLAMADADWDRLLAVNLDAPMLLTRRLLPSLLERPEAHVVNVASMYGLFALRKACAYHVSKFGMVGFGEALRAEFGPRGLGVTTVCPGFVRTNLFESGMLGAATAKAPPAWISTTPEHVADLTIRAIYRNRRQVVVTWLARSLHLVKRFVPSLFDWCLQRRKPFLVGRNKRSAVPAVLCCLPSFRARR